VGIYVGETTWRKADLGEGPMRKWVGAAVVTLLLLVPGTQSWSQGQLQPLSFGVIIWRSPTLTAVREALLKMADDPEGAQVLAASADVLKQAQPLRLVASKDREFDSMRKFYRTTLVKVELQ
jgi:hypothetical protein